MRASGVGPGKAYQGALIFDMLLGVGLSAHSSLTVSLRLAPGLRPLTSEEILAIGKGPLRPEVAEEFAGQRAASREQRATCHS